MANNPNAKNPLYTDRDLPNGTGVTAQDARLGLGNLTQSTGVSMGWAHGVYPSRSTGGTIQDLRVVPATPTPNMTTFVQTGGHQVSRTSRGPYQAFLSSGLSVTHSASNASNPRKDYVVARVRDPGYDGTVLRTLEFLVLQGSPAASPIEPTSQVTDGDVVLASVTIRAGATTIVAGDIEDRRMFNVARGGVYPKSAYDNRDGTYAGQLRYNVAAQTFEGWSGTNWVPVASMTQWGEFTPDLRYRGANNAGPSGSVNLGTGGSPRAVGRWSLLGKTLDFSYHFRYGTTGYFAGPGDIYTPLPLHINGQMFRNPDRTQWCHAHLFVNVPQLWGDFIGGGLLQSNVQDIVPFFALDYNTSRTGPHRVATATGAHSTGIPLVPGGFPQGGELHLNGTVETVVP